MARYNVTSRVQPIYADETIQIQDDHIWQFSVTNEGDTTLKVGWEGAGTPVLTIPPKPEDSPGYPRVSTTYNPLIPFADNLVLEFEGGSGQAHVIVYRTIVDKNPFLSEVHPE